MYRSASYELVLRWERVVGNGKDGERWLAACHPWCHQAVAVTVGR